MFLQKFYPQGTWTTDPWVQEHSTTTLHERPGPDDKGMGWQEEWHNFN